MKRIVIGILAHVDAGKTTLSEALLYRGGALRAPGRVDHGDAFLDTAELEKARGITIFSKPAVLAHPQVTITLLDTPGHADFSAEAERTLQALDAAVLVVSGVDGVQSHTETLWRLLARYGVPTLLFVNKTDLPGQPRRSLLAELRRRLGQGVVDFSADVPAPARDEALALCDEALMEQYLADGALPHSAIADAVARRTVFPCWFGSALRCQGVDELLDGLRRYVQPAPATAAFGALVYKISRDETGRRLTWMKITGGSLSAKALLTSRPGQTPAWSEKVDQLRLYSGAKATAISQALPGMVVAATGLAHTQAGQGLGAAPDALAPALAPVLAYQVLVPPQTDLHTALEQLRTLAQEDPQLHLVWDEALGQIHLQVMGEVQLEVLTALIAQRFGWQPGFGAGGILYKETITQAAEGVGHYEPLRHYAEVHLLLEPLPRGSGLQFATSCREDALDKNWQRLILTHLAEKPHKGVLAGAPLTDVKITLLAGRAHEKHTEGGDFRQATYRAVRQGLRSTQSLLLEPWYDFRLTLPAACVGRAMADIQQMGGSFAPPQPAEGDAALLTGRAPAAELQDYQRLLTGYTRGRGRLACALAGYDACHNAAQVLAARGYDPDRDLDDPADSVFCRHGAGYVVKWSDVPAHAHIDTGWGKPAPAPDAPAVRRRAAAYAGTLAEDKELLAIFERTYGPVKRPARRALAPVEKPAPQPAAPLPQGPEYLLVDGYNVIYAWPELARLAADNLDAARRRLMDMLCNYQGYRGCVTILVFDAYRVKNNPGSVEPYHGIRVVYTKEAETADAYIERATHDIGRQHRVRVVTSDGAEQLIILGEGGLRVSARAFRQELDAVEKAIRQCLEGAAQG